MYFHSRGYTIHISGYDKMWCKILINLTEPEGYLNKKNEKMWHHKCCFWWLWWTREASISLIGHLSSSFLCNFSHDLRTATPCHEHVYWLHSPPNRTNGNAMRKNVLCPEQHGQFKDMECFINQANISTDNDTGTWMPDVPGWCCNASRHAIWRYACKQFPWFQRTFDNR